MNQVKDEMTLWGNKADAQRRRLVGAASGRLGPREEKMTDESSRLKQRASTQPWQQDICSSNGTQSIASYSWLSCKRGKRLRAKMDSTWTCKCDGTAVESRA